MRIGIAAALILLSAGAVTPSAGAPAPGPEPATSRLAHDFLHALFVDGDSTGAYRRYAAPDLIQHNPEMADGLAGREAYFARRAQAGGGEPAPSAWANVIDNVIVDGDLIAVHHHMFRGPDDPGRVFVDIWRVQGGRIVEHWDVIQPVPDHRLNPDPMWCGAGSDYSSARRQGDTLARPACGRPDPRARRAESLRVVNAYAAALGGGEVEAAVHGWFAPNYRQHSPQIAPGAKGAIDYLRAEFAKPAALRPQGQTVRVIAQGDLVLFHRHVVRPGGGEETVQADIFRVTDGRISEHWDVKQKVPASTASGRPVW